MAEEGVFELIEGVRLIAYPLLDRGVPFKYCFHLEARYSDRELERHSYYRELETGS